MPVNSKQNLIIRLGIIVLVVTMLLTVFVGGTYAKYATMGTSSDKARVAVFTVERIGTEYNSVQIFQSAYKGVGENADKDTVKGDKDIIAPGTEGRFDIIINYKMEVAASYTFTFEEIQTPADANIPLIYSIDDGNTWYDVAQLKIAIESDINTTLEPGNGQKIIKVLWKWAFTEDMQNSHEQSNGKDTELGFDAKSEVILNMQLEVTQID